MLGEGRTGPTAEYRGAASETVYEHVASLCQGCLPAKIFQIIANDSDELYSSHCAVCDFDVGRASFKAEEAFQPCESYSILSELKTHHFVVTLCAKDGRKLAAGEH